MGRYDGCYRLESSRNAEAFLAETGLPESDIKLLLDPGNVVTLSVLSNSNGSYTLAEKYSMAPHFNSTITAKVGEAKKVEKPFPMTILWTKKSDTESCQRTEWNGKVILSQFKWNNCGVTVTSCVEGSAVRCVDTYCRVSRPVNGYYVLEREENMARFIEATTSAATAAAVGKIIKAGGFAFTLRECGDSLSITESFGDIKKEVVYGYDQAVDYCNKELGLEETRLLTRLSPGKWKMVTKNKKTGKVSEVTATFTETGLSETLSCGGVTATACYRRCPDIDGCWKVVCMEGGAAYMEACGVPEPLKSELLEARDCFQMERLPGGKVSSKTTSKFWPPEFVTKWDEQWELEMPGIGTMRGVSTEHRDTIMVCMKFGDKKINIKEKISGDFLIQESEVDGCQAARMKSILVRQ